MIEPRLFPDEPAHDHAERLIEQQIALDAERYWAMRREMTEQFPRRLTPTERKKQTKDQQPDRRPDPGN